MDFLVRNYRTLILLLFTQVSFLFSHNQVPARLGNNIDEINNIETPYFQFKHIGVEEGLHQKTIYSILQDRRGYLWLGTNEGLVRYDGYRFKTYSKHMDDSTSLSNNHINCLFEDSRGWLWAGTEDGLNYYNPNTETFVRLRTFPEKFGKENPNTIFSISEDSSGAIWTATIYGINRIQIKQNQQPSQKFNSSGFNNNPGQIQTSHFLPNPYTNSSQNVVYSLLIDHRGNIWVGSYAGLMRLTLSTTKKEPKSVSAGEYKFEKIFNRLSALKQMVLALQEDKNGIIWMQTSDGLVRIDPSQGAGKETLVYKQYVYDHGLFTLGALLEVQDKGGSNLWINLKDDGFAIFNPRTETFSRIRNDSTNKSNISIPYYIHTIYRSRGGIFWFGTETGGLFKYDPVFTRFSDYNPKLNTHISNRLIDMRFVFEDSHDILWIANQGVYRCNRNTGNILSSYWQNIKAPYWTFKNNICEDGLGNVWIGSEFGGLYRYNYQSQKMTAMLNFSLNAEDTLKDLNDIDIRAFLSDSLKRKKHTFENITQMSENITAITPDHRGNIWTGAWVDLFSDSLDMQIKKSYLNITHIDVFNHKIYNYRLLDLTKSKKIENKQYIYSIHTERSGILWVGSSFGLIRFEPQTGVKRVFRAVSGDPQSLSYNRVHAVTEDKHYPERYLWIGTDGGGLCRFDKNTETFKRYGIKDGLPGNIVSSVLTDAHGNLWLGTDKGLSNALIDSASDEIVQFINYDQSDGIIDGDFSFFYGQNAHKNSRGDMFFAGSKGISVFKPDSIRGNLNPPPLVLSQFYLNFKPVDFHKPGSPLKKPVSRLKSITLSNNDNSFAIEMSALNFHSPEKNRFAYKLEGYQDEWIYPGAERRAIFTRVPPGEYTFRAKAANSNGIWNEKGVVLKINIVPPWYKTRWAYGLYAVFFFGVILSIRRYEMNRQKHKMQAQMQKDETEKLKEIDTLKTRFFTNISHEFRTPLALIKGPAEQELENAHSSATRRRMQMIGRNVNRLLHLIGQLLDLTALEARHMSLRAVETNIIPFVQGLFMGFASWAERKNINLKLFSKEKKIDVYFDRDLMEKILNNLLSNAIKFSREGGKIEMTLRLGDDNHFVELIIKDDGIGIPEDKLAHIFDRFYQVDASTTREQEGTGIGLALVKELVELHKGTISVESREGLGTTFTIILPLGSEHLRPDQIMASVTESKRVHKVSANEFDYTHDDGNCETDTTSENADEQPLVLIVEDHKDFRHFMIDTLQKDYRIMEASNGESALTIACEKIPDLIISDVMMPRMNGYTLCAKIKNDERTSHIPVILLTAKAAPDDKLEGLEAGADDYLSKPFDSRELLSRVQNLIIQRRKLQQYYQQNLLVKTLKKPVLSTDEKFLQKALSIVEENLENEKFSVDDLAEGVGMSRSQLHRKIHALTGKPATHFIRTIRLQHAAEFIRANAGNITEIAYKVGFSSQSYFTKCFAEQFSCSPSEYKKRNI